MYELIQAGEDTFYMDCPTKVGFFRIKEDTVVLIDSGSDKDAGRKVKKILDTQGWKVDAIFHTHSHADHIGGNQYLQRQTGCKIYAPGMERAFTEFPVLEPALLYGAVPFKELCSKFLMAKESDVLPLTEEVLPEGLKMIPLPGHCCEMVGFQTRDDVIFLGDALSGTDTLNKYPIGYLFDVEQYLQSLKRITKMNVKQFIPSHAPVCSEIEALAQYNIEQTAIISDRIEERLFAPMLFEELLSQIFADFGMTMDLTQRMLVGGTVKAYLSYLKKNGRVDYRFEENRMLWYSVK